MMKGDSLLEEYLAVVRSGLRPGAGPAKRIVVVGAGMAGLVAATQLVQAGHDVTVLEAQLRAGGRVLTLRAPFLSGLYAEAGAMRFPKAHALTMAYVDKFGLSTGPFVTHNPRAFYSIGGRSLRISDADANPELLGFDRAGPERGKTAQSLWEEALAPALAPFRTRPKGGWPGMLARYDQVSTQQFLEASGWSPNAIEMFGVLSNQEALLSTSFAEVLIEELEHSYADLVQIRGGMDRLPSALLPGIQDKIRFGAQVVALEQDSDSVTVHYQTPSGRSAVSGDRALVTIPFSVLRYVDVLQPFSHGKQRAIRELHYDASTKIFLQCRRRFWEQDDGIFGGRTVTDLPIRTLYYPEHGRETGRGVLLASYTWAEDAQRWASLPAGERVVRAASDVARIHPQVQQELEGGTSKAWQDDPYAGGAFAAYAPGQMTLLYEHIVAPEGRIHFAGEHASLNHAWVQGAIHSALRAAFEVHQASS